MVLFHAYREGNELHKNAWMHDDNDAMILLGVSFRHLMSDRTTLFSPELFDRYRDEFHDLLSAHNPVNFQRYGNVGASAAAILDHVFPTSMRSISLHLSCSMAGCMSEVQAPVRASFPGVIVSVRTRSNKELPMATYSSIQTWLDAWLRDHCEHHYENALLVPHVSSSCPGSVFLHLFVTAPPPVLFFECGTQISHLVRPGPAITIPIQNGKAIFRLKGIIYIGGFHYRVRLFSDSDVWHYDGRENYGNPLLEPDDSLTDLRGLSGSVVDVYVYALDEIVQ